MKMLFKLREVMATILTTSVLLLAPSCDKDDELSSDDDTPKHEYVDMGLPSGDLWATCNIGASKPEDAGQYFAWGETKPKDYYSWASYTIGEFVGDGKATLDKEDDAASVNWGGDWYTPDYDDLQEMSNNCTCEDAILNGVDGCLVTGPNGNSIFLAYAGYVGDSGLSYYGEDGEYMSSSLEPQYVEDSRVMVSFNVSGNTHKVSCGARARNICLPVRAVCPSKGDVNGHNSVDLGLPSGKLWATCNIGASKPEEAGLYFAWGETEPKDVFSYDTYKHVEKDESIMYRYQITKYQIKDINLNASWYKNVRYCKADGKKRLDKSDDAASVNWGGNWTIPTKEQWSDLFLNSEVKLVDAENTEYSLDEYFNQRPSIIGLVAISKVNGNRLFLPSSGYIRYDYIMKDGGLGDVLLSTSDLSRESVPRFEMNLSRCESSYSTIWGVMNNSLERCYGLPIRPVWVVNQAQE